jgi:hypothetical protein
MLGINSSAEIDKRGIGQLEGQAIGRFTILSNALTVAELIPRSFTNSANQAPKVNMNYYFNSEHPRNDHQIYPNASNAAVEFVTDKDTSIMLAHSAVESAHQPVAATDPGNESTSANYNYSAEQLQATQQLSPTTTTGSAELSADQQAYLNAAQSEVAAAHEQSVPTNIAAKLGGY